MEALGRHPRRRAGIQIRFCQQFRMAKESAMG